MSKPGWCGVVAASVGILLQVHGGFTGNPETAFLGYLVFLLCVGWSVLLVLLGTLPPSFGDSIGFAIVLAMCAGAFSTFVSFPRSLPHLGTRVHNLASGRNGYGIPPGTGSPGTGLNHGPSPGLPTGAYSTRAPDSAHTPALTPTSPAVGTAPGQLVSTSTSTFNTISVTSSSTAAPPLDSRPELACESAHRSYQLGDLAPSPERLSAVATMLPRMAVAGRRTRRSSTVHPASAIRHRRRPAWRPSPSARSASRRRVHGVVPHFRVHPLPPGRSTAPTIACPPSFTVTCSTRTVCCPDFPRWRFNASISAALVRLSRFA